MTRFLGSVDFEISPGPGVCFRSAERQEVLE